MTEFALPILLLRRPRAGLASVALFHLALSLAMPDLWVFSLAMTADAALFLR